MTHANITNRFATFGSQLSATLQAFVAALAFFVLFSCTFAFTPQAAFADTYGLTIAETNCDGTWTNGSSEGLLHKSFASDTKRFASNVFPNADSDHLTELSDITSRKQLKSALKNTFSQAASGDNCVIFIAAHGDDCGGISFGSSEDGEFLNVDAETFRIWCNDYIHGNCIIVTEQCYGGTFVREFTTGDWLDRQNHKNYEQRKAKLVNMLRKARQEHRTNQAQSITERLDDLESTEKQYTAKYLKGNDRITVMTSTGSSSCYSGCANPWFIELVKARSGNGSVKAHSLTLADLYDATSSEVYTYNKSCNGELRDSFDPSAAGVELATRGVLFNRSLAAKTFIVR